MYKFSGVGTNACYVEDLSNVHRWSGGERPGSEQVIINTEWCAFGEHGELDFIKTKYDDYIDKGSENRGQHMYVILKILQINPQQNNHCLKIYPSTTT